MGDQDIIILSDASHSDDDIAFVRSNLAGPSSFPLLRRPHLVDDDAIEILDSSEVEYEHHLGSDGLDFDAALTSIITPSFQPLTSPHREGREINDIRRDSRDQSKVDARPEYIHDTHINNSKGKAHGQPPSLPNTTTRPALHILDDAVIVSPPHKIASRYVEQQSPPKTKRKSKRRMPDLEAPRRNLVDHESSNYTDKMERQLARESAKAAKLADRSYRKKLQEVNRSRKTKSDALCEIELHLSHDLSLQTSPIAGAIPELEQRLKGSLSSLSFLPKEDTLAPGTIRFLRRSRAKWDSEGKQFIPLDQECLAWEQTTVLVATAEEIVDRVAQSGDSLAQWLADLRRNLHLAVTEHILLLVRGLEKYHAKTKSLAARDFRDAARANLAGKGPMPSIAHTFEERLGKEALERKLLAVQVTQRVFVVHVDKTEEIGDWLYNLAGDIAIRPYKHLSKSHLPFSTPDHPRKSLAATESLELMLQEVQGLTASAAAGIALEYPSWRELMAAYDQAENRGLALAEDMVVDCQVRSLKNGAAASRKIGKALSRKVFNLMRGDDPLSLA